MTNQNNNVKSTAEMHTRFEHERRKIETLLWKLLCN